MITAFPFIISLSQAEKSVMASDTPSHNADDGTSLIPISLKNGTKIAFFIKTCQKKLAIIVKSAGRVYHERSKRSRKESHRFIEQNLGKEINLDNISKNIGYSKFHLNRIFTEYTGITIYKYLQNRRLTIAAEKLVKTDTPITQIAYEAGYDTQQSFSFAFKQIYFYPPKIYRDTGIFVPKQNRISMCHSRVPKYNKFIAEIKEVAA